jgi:hypothetical protein
MMAKCDCQKCGRPIEFDATQLKKVGETSHRIIGQFIACPHCQERTQLYLYHDAIPVPAQTAGDSPIKRNSFQIAAIWCWSTGGVLIVLPTFAMLVIDENGSGGDFGLWLSRLSITGLVVGILLLATGAVLHKIGSSRARLN